MKNIVIVRNEYLKTCTKGLLYIDGRLILSTLEPFDPYFDDNTTLGFINERKKLGTCAIPSGTYRVVLNYSPLNKEVVPCVLGVLGYENIEIHVGNSSLDTKGCILVGSQIESGKDWIGYSRTGFRILMTYLKEVKNDNFTLTIKRN